MQRFLCSVIALLMLTGLVSSVSAHAADYNGHWAEDTIELWVYNHFIETDYDGNVYPDEPMTRGDYASILYDFLQLEPAPDTTRVFTDLSWTARHTSKIMAIHDIGVMSGYPDHTFRPEAALTRNEVAVLLCRVFTCNDVRYPSSLPTDVKDIPDWSKDAVLSLFDEGLMSGYPDGKFGGSKWITRAEALALSSRIMEKRASEMEYSPDITHYEVDMQEEFAYPLIEQTPVAGEAEQEQPFHTIVEPSGAIIYIYLSGKVVRVEPSAEPDEWFIEDDQVVIHGDDKAEESAGVSEEEGAAEEWTAYDSEEVSKAEPSNELQEWHSYYQYYVDNGLFRQMNKYYIGFQPNFDSNAFNSTYIVYGRIFEKTGQLFQFSQKAGLNGNKWYYYSNDPVNQEKFASVNDLIEKYGPVVENVVVSFQVDQGARAPYGHLVFIEAIVDGYVYYADTIYGKEHTNEVFRLTIEEFFSHYEQELSASPIGFIKIHGERTEELPDPVETVSPAVSIKQNPVDQPVVVDPEVTLPFQAPKITGGSELEANISIASVLNTVKDAALKKLIMDELKDLAEPHKHLQKWIPIVKVTDKVVGASKVLMTLGNSVFGFLNKEKRIALENATSNMNQTEELYLELIKRALKDRRTGQYFDLATLQGFDKSITKLLDTSIENADKFRKISGVERFFTNKEDLRNAEQVYQALIEIKKQRPSMVEFYKSIRYS